MRDLEKGFTLVELLVILLVIGVLATVAVPSLLRHHDRARIATVESDLRNAAAAQASLAISQGEASSELSALVEVGFRSSPGVLFTNDGHFTAHSSGMCMQATHDGLPGRSWAFAAEGPANPFEGTC